ncbi:hypothetical protein [Sphingomonas baiyangensis]|nr:hypothetical protein [Sphingomonas baiyangensis]
MKAFLIGSAAVLTMLAAPASAQDEVLTVNNRTGYTISEIYIAPTTTDEWEEDIMGDDVLPSGRSVDIDFSRSEETCVWDMKAVYDDDTNAVWRKINLCEISAISLFYNENTGVTSARYE